jgi:hypothetical protein
VIQIARGWKSQIANGRVFELRSRSKTKPAPCALIVDATAGYGGRFAVEIDENGIVDYDSRGHHQDVRIYDLHRHFDGSQIARRREDLERFNEDDMALIRYGRALDFDGRIADRHNPHIPLTKVPAEWTVLWFPAYGKDEYRYPDFKRRNQEHKLFAGSWHFDCYGGAAHLGYKYGHAWGTMHAGKRLDKIRTFLKRQFPDLVETQVHVIRSTNRQGQSCVTSEYDGECAPLGDGRTTITETPQGCQVCCGPRELTK